jgi:Bacterial SH3 domain
MTSQRSLRTEIPLSFSAQANPLKVNSMSFHRSVILSLITLCAALTLNHLPVTAQEGELAAQDAQSQVNLRAEANTQAGIVATGKVGDRVQILSTSTKDGQTWYRIKVLQSGTVGWVRGDLIKVLGSAKTATPQKPTVKATLKGSSKNSAPAGLKLPKTLAKAPTSKSTAVPPKPAATIAPAPHSAIATPAAIILSFQTPTYAVKIFSETGHLRLNLFNRKSQQLVLEAVPVESKTTGKTTTYSYSSDLKVTIVVPAQGSPTLTTMALGNTVQEEPETNPPPTGATDTAPPKTTN